MKITQQALDLEKANKKIMDLLKNAGSTDYAELFNTACEAHAITSQLCIEIDKAITPSFVKKEASK